MDAPVLPDSMGKGDEAEMFRQLANQRHRVCIIDVSRLDHRDQWGYDQLTPTVHSAIYEPTRSPEGCDAAEMRGRWIHLSANNEKWIHDLMMKKLKVRYGHISDYRDRGYGSMAAINLHFVPQATRTRQYVKLVALFMPVLGYDTHCNRKRLARAFQETYEGAKSGKHPPRETECSANEALILGYQYTRRPRYPQRRQVHPRQTLHRFGYNMITSTETKDRNQVSFRWAEMEMHRHRKKSYRPVIMVDQLWLWMLEDGTLITCCPEPSSRHWGSSTIKALDPDNLARLRDLGLLGVPGTEPKTQVVSHLVLRHLLDFGSQWGPLEFNFKDGFKASINRIVELENSLFRRFTAATKLSHETLASGTSAKDSDDDFLNRSDLETNLLVDLMAIQDELNIIQTVQTQQRAVLEELRRIYQGSRTKANGDFDCLLDRQLDDEEEKARNLELMRGTFEVLDENAVVVEQLLADAAKVQRSVESLLTFKQMHANTMEARLRRRREETAERSENTLKAFGLISLLFLPLSFASSLFALDVDVFPKDEAGEQSWPIRQVMGLIFGISAGILLVLVTLSLSINEILAFSRHWRRKLLSTTPTPSPTTPSSPHPAAHDSDTDSVPDSPYHSDGSERSAMTGTEYVDDDVFDSCTSSSSDEEEEEERRRAPRRAGSVGSGEGEGEEPVAAEESSAQPSNPPAPAPAPAPPTVSTSAVDGLRGRGPHSQGGGGVDVDVEKGVVEAEKGHGVLEVGEKVNCSPQ